ncbi:hypothetical protein [Psychromicrobium xiongbiense]|uniref:hypothetical protein n=1 Tax=Psychromicrobium xiongbiense TaxID=3051184 RepID=UPI002557781E|nr:hypothetical protein [Psychromicrobium sp. YIM S02556]
MSNPAPEPGPGPGTPDPQSPSPAAPRVPGHYEEIAPGLPRYGQYAPPGYQPPTQPAATGQHSLGTPSSSGMLSQAAPGSARPALVNRAFVLILAAGVLQLISLIAALPILNDPQYRQALQQMVAGFGPISDTELTAAIYLGMGLNVVLAGLYALVAFKVRSGRGWARMLGTIFAVVSLLLIVVPNVLAILQVGLGAIGIVCCWLPAARGYFRR